MIRLRLLIYLVFVCLIGTMLPAAAIIPSSSINLAEADQRSVAQAPQPFGPDEAPAGRTTTPATSGTLRFAAEIDADGDPTTNPSAVTSVPVDRISTPAGEDSTASTTIALAVEVVPRRAEQNPAGIPVTFHLWNKDAQLDLVKHATADAWGATYVQFLLDDLHLRGRFSYRASAPGFGETMVRTFTVDTDLLSLTIACRCSSPKSRNVILVCAERYYMSQYLRSLAESWGQYGTSRTANHL